MVHPNRFAAVGGLIAIPQRSIGLHQEFADVRAYV